MHLIHLTTVLSLFTLSAWSASLTVTLSCQTCSINCAYSSCYLMTAPGYKNEVCGYEACALATNITKIINTCSNSFNGQICSSGLCEYLPTSGCANSILGVTVCSSTPSFYASTCVTCANQTATCSKCTELQTNAGSFQVCLGSSCNGAININTTIASCTGGKDSIGNQCTCCYTSDSSLNGKIGVCTTESLFLSSNDFKVYATKQIASTTNPTTGGFESRLFMSLLVLCGLFMALL